MNIIVAVDAEWGIGNKGDLLARVKEDLQNFAKLTTGKIVILGSNTLATFPGGRVLKDRQNIVLNPDLDYAPEGATVAHSLDELFEIIKNLEEHGTPSDDIFIIGGASVYRQMLPYCNKAYITKFKKSFEKDVYFPNLDEMPEWSVISESNEIKANYRGAAGAQGEIYFTFVTYVKK